jgi:pimeloyl-ACP methyl ester carboxylesterase
MTVTSDAVWTTEDVKVCGVAVRLRKRGAGSPLFVLHHDIGTLESLPFYESLSQRFTVYLPSHPGYDGAERPAWLRSARDVAVIYQALLALLELGPVNLVGLGFGGWLAAEMATMSPQAFRRVVLVGAMGVKPTQGEILDQALLSYIAYARAGFEDQRAFDRLYGADPSTAQLEQWDLNREMTFRIAWKPYMYNPALPHLLGGVRSRTLVVWGRGDTVVPLECGEAYARAIPGSRLSVVGRSGHCVDMEQPDALVKLISEFTAGS